jgi:hypothetical protein
MIDKRMTYFIIGAVVALLINLRACEKKSELRSHDDRVVIDTVYVDKIIKVPEIKEVFINLTPEPKIIYKADPDLLKQFSDLEDENEKLKIYAEAITKRTYEKTYVSADSVVKIVVKDSVTGVLDFQSIDFNISEREIIYRDKIITKTIEKKPDFSISLGAGIKVPTIFSDPVSLEAVIGIKSKKGFGYQLGIDTNKEFRLTLTKDLFTKY